MRTRRGSTRGGPSYGVRSARRPTTSSSCPWRALRPRRGSTSWCGRSPKRTIGGSSSSSRAKAESERGSSGLRETPECVLVLTGDVEWERIVELYVAADVFALLSEREPWAVVVNEAAACGLPLVLSDRVGAAHDLLRDGENGALVPAGDVAGRGGGTPRARGRSGTSPRAGSALARARTRLGLRAERPGLPRRRARSRTRSKLASSRAPTSDSRPEPVLLARRRGDRALAHRAVRSARGGLRRRGRHGRPPRSRGRAAPDRAQRRRHHTRCVDVLRALRAGASGRELRLIPRLGAATRLERSSARTSSSA